MGVAIIGKDVSLISSIAGKAKATIANVGGIAGWAGGGGDVTPDAVNWANIAYYEGGDDGPAGIQQIKNISTSITLKVSWTGSPVKMYYRINSTAPTWTNGGIFQHGGADNSAFVTSTRLTNSAGSTFTVSNNEYVSFICYIDGGYGTGTVTVKNQSDGDIVLDTFTWTVDFF
jgi:hypothetical protein